MTPQEPIEVLSDQEWFDHFGDMCTPSELRALKLTDPEAMMWRGLWLAEYEQAGIAEDQDPGAFTFDLIAEQGETVEDLSVRAVAAVGDLVAIRRMKPSDVNETP